MADVTFESYREALRSGHVAALRGRLREAVAAYREAIALAPDRALPRTSLGGVWLRLGDPAAALDAFAGAIERDPDDESALLGQAEAYASSGRPVEAAASLDRAATIQAAAGRASDALDTLRRAIEFESTVARTTRYAALRAGLRPTGPEANVELTSALVALDASSMPVAGGHVTSMPLAPVDVVGATIGEIDPAAAADRDAEVAAAAAAAAARTAEDAHEALVREGEAHWRTATSSLDAGSIDGARADLLEAARSFAHAGLTNAALDACHRAIELGPADPDVHLEFIEIFVDRGWRELAADKAVALLRLIELAGDVSGHRRVCRVAMRTLRSDPRIEELCA